MGKTKYKDLRGVIIEEEDYIIYGKSDRYHPVKLGTVVAILEDGIKVLGDGNNKTGKLKAYDISERVLVLPCDYRSFDGNSN